MWHLVSEIIPRSEEEEAGIGADAGGSIMPS
jgi:hypothetical protein